MTASIIGRINVNAKRTTGYVATVPAGGQRYEQGRELYTLVGA